MTIKELKDLRVAVAAGTTDTDTALDTLANDYADEVMEYGFDDVEGLGCQIAQHMEDIQWLKNFVEDADGDLNWHYLDGYDWIDDTNIQDNVVDLIDDLIAAEKED